MNWADDYPRPLLRRADWTTLDGEWDFALDPEAAWTIPGQVSWDRSITVPYSPETPASGIGETGYFLACWYRREIAAPELGPDERLLLHFGAVDDIATVWVNDQLAARHEGCYTPFTIDLTDYLTDEPRFTITVRAEDDPHDLAKPRGKQDWQRDPHAIWYPRTTGIWQTVWLERVPATRIGELHWSCDLAAWAIDLEARIVSPGVQRDDLLLHVTLSVNSGQRLLADDTYTVVANGVGRRITLIDPGIDDARKALLWTPDTPTLITAEVRLVTTSGEVLDEVGSYTAMREVRIEGDRFILNGRPLYLRMVLDQGYWPETGLTAPDTAAFRRDIELTKAMGFNGARKHQKIEDPRYLGLCDRLGLLVWEEMPSAYRFTRHSIERLTREWTAVLRRDISHPCIVAWVPFNESWGVPDLPTNPAHREYVAALYHLTKSIDPSRPVIGNDGWEAIATDIIGIHDYESRLGIFPERYGSVESIPEMLHRVRPAGRQLTLDGFAYSGQPLMLSEFGGIAFTPARESGATWGYSRSQSADAFAKQYGDLLATVQQLLIFTGFCYTQLTDTYQEANGLLYADRTPKIPIEQIARFTSKPKTAIEAEREHYAALREGGHSTEARA